MGEKSIFGAMSYYIGSCYTNENGEFDTRSCIDGYFPIIATKDYALDLIGNTLSFYTDVLDDETSDVAEDERISIRQMSRKLGDMLSQLRDTASSYVVVGGKDVACGSIFPVECYCLIDELQNVELTNAVREWIEKYHSILGDKLSPITAIVNQIDTEFDKLVNNVRSRLSDYYEPYFETDSAGTGKFHFFVKTDYALEKLRSSLSYYESDELKASIDESNKDKVQWVIDDLKKDISCFEHTTSQYCIIREGFDPYVFEEVEVSTLIKVLHSSSFSALLDFLLRFHQDAKCTPFLISVVKSFIYNRIPEIVFSNLLKNSK